MSTKSTILLTNCCHIYRDATYQHTCDSSDHSEDCLVIDVSYDTIGDLESNDCIVVEWDSDFAAMILFMVKTCVAYELDKFCREHWIKMD